MNFIKSVEKQIANGYVYIAKDGNFMTAEKVTQLARKAYVKGLGDGSISFSTSFETFYDYFVKDYRTSKDVLNALFGMTEDTEQSE